MSKNPPFDYFEMDIDPHCIARDYGVDELEFSKWLQKQEDVLEDTLYDLCMGMILYKFSTRNQKPPLKFGSTMSLLPLTKTLETHDETSS